jgi:flagellar basal-body rod modification protein FlgD
MEITQAQTTSALAAPTALQETSKKEISSDFETFLRMLTVQMQNQDPLDPVDSSDYAVQLATFSNVEQQVQTNDLLRELKGQLGLTGIAQMADWVGKEARVVAPAQVDGAPITLFPSPATAATDADIVVRDATGFEVARFTVPAKSEPVEWDGLKTDGSPFSPGLYTFDVESFDGDELLESSQAAVYATISEIQKTAEGDTLAVLEGGTTIPTSDITAIRNASGA